MNKRREKEVLTRFVLVAGASVLIFFLFSISNKLTSPTGAWSKEGTVYTCENCSDCTNAIADASAGDTIRLSAPTVSANFGCINISKENIVFDCLGNTITGNGAATGNGINISFSNHTKIQNCKAVDFENSLYLYKSNNITLINITASSSEYGIYIRGVSNSKFINITASENTECGIFEYYWGFPGDVDSSYNTYTNITIKDTTREGMELDGDYNNLTNVLLANNNWGGLTLSSANYNTFTNINSSFNNGEGTQGLVVSNSFYNNFTDISTNNNDIGVYIESSDYNTFYNVTSNDNLPVGGTTPGRGFYIVGGSDYNNFTNTISNNNRKGVYLSEGGIAGCEYNIFDNITVNNNSEGGIFFDVESRYNTLKNSFIQLNSVSGLNFTDSLAEPAQGNFIYNNYFNNTVAYYNGTAEVTNYFNTTLASGTNIVGGSYLGGNYWAAPNGSGFSQICTSSTNGICDTVYSLDGYNYDYLPLVCEEEWSCTDWSICSSSGVQTRTCVDANLCQTYEDKPDESQACSAEPGSTTTSGESAISSQTTVVSMKSGSSTHVDIFEKDLDIIQIIIASNKDIEDAAITVEEINYSDNFKLKNEGEIYKTFSIFSEEINKTDVINATIKFKIKKAWIDDSFLNLSKVLLFRNEGNGEGSWNQLNTRITSKDDTSYYFSAFSPGFSLFTVFAYKEECAPNQKKCYGNKLLACSSEKEWGIDRRCLYRCSNNQCVSADVFLYLIIVILIIAGVIVTMVIVRLLLGQSSQSSVLEAYGPGA